jgi:rSAM/selenodomain-associated transferase 2
MAAPQAYCNASYVNQPAATYKMRLSIIIPTLDEATTIRGQAASLQRWRGQTEIIVADGGSTDGTVEIARECGLRVIRAARGRGQQMNAGARVASGEVLLFLHADTRLPNDMLELIASALEDPCAYGGNFSLLFAGGTRAARLLTKIYPFLRLGGMCYGDSAIFVRRSVFERLGGYRDFPIFEDVDLFRRMKRCGRFVRLPACATTSARRFEGQFIRTFALWSVLQVLYWLGVSPRKLERLYRPAR